MNKEDYVSFNIAKLMKDAGFCEQCNHYYRIHDTENDVRFWWMQSFENMNEQHSAFSAPTLWQAQKWMREVKKINVLVGDCACGYYWEVSKAGDEQTRGTMLIHYDDKGEDENSGMWLSYEAALSAGIEAALELINCK